MLLVALALPNDATVRYFARLFLRTGNGSSGLRSATRAAAHPLLASRTPLRGENANVGIVGQSVDYSAGAMDYADSKPLNVGYILVNPWISRFSTLVGRLCR
jgi:hypothetical protein